MNKLFLAIFLILIASPAWAEYKFADQWNWQDSVLEGVFAAEVAVDLGQTLYQSEHPNQYEEMNPLLPRHPSKDQVWGACIIGAGLHAVVSMALPKKYRTWWQSLTIMLEAGNIIRNKSIGIGMAF